MIRRMSILAVVMLQGFALAEMPPVVDANPSYQSPEYHSNPSEGGGAPPPQMISSGDEGAAPRMQSQSAIESPNSILLGKLEALQKEVQELRGKQEIAMHELQVLTEQQRTLYKDLDTRVSKLMAEPTNTAAKAADSAAETPSAETPKADKISLSGNAKAEQQYESAYALIKSKDYAQAVPALQAMLRDHPNSAYTANTHYWLGEVYLAQGEYNKALEEFKIVTTDFPNSSKVSYALLKSGIAYESLGRPQMAQQEFSKLAQQFPDSPAAVLAKAKS
jgi:tol-pal system protein YbgF